MSNKPKIGFVGTGRMGANMALHLHDCGYPVTAILNRSPEKAAEIASQIGAKTCHSLPEVTAAADIIITVVPDDQAMREIFSTQKESLLTGAHGKLFINCATVSPGIHRMVEAAAATAGAETVEACMASSIDQARNGSLYLLCGGLEGAFRRAKPVLHDLASKIRHLGSAGSASEVKILTNLVMNINTAALAEGLALGDALGIDLTTLREIFSETGAASRVLETDGIDMQEREHDCYYSAAHVAKDSTLALELAKNKKLTLPLSETTEKQYRKMVEYGLGHLDKSGIAEIVFKNRHIR